MNSSNSIKFETLKYTESITQLDYNNVFSENVYMHCKH